jgi:hypothetical protein
MKNSTPLLRHFAALLASSAALAADEVVIDDHFDDQNPVGTATAPAFWKLQAITGDNGVFENNGYLTLFATTQPYTFAGINSSLDQRLDFFDHAVTIAAENLVLEAKDVPGPEAVFRVSLNSTERRQNMSPQSVSLRFVPGLALFGFKTRNIEKVAAEDLTGENRASVIFERFDGTATGFSLTLDPLASPGFITVTLVIRTNSPRPVITHTARLDLRRSDWESGGPSALVMEARRNHATTAPDSYMSASIDRLTVTAHSR